MTAAKLMAAIGHIDDDIALEVIEKMNYSGDKRSRGIRHKAIPALAAVFALLLALGITAYALDWFGFSYQLSPAEDPSDVKPYFVMQNEDKTEFTGGWIAPNGTADSPEALANYEFVKLSDEALERAQWSRAEELYSWWESLGEYSGIAEAYSCSDREMLDALLALSDKYGLKLHNEIRHIWSEGLEFAPFILSEDADCMVKRLFEDGSFDAEGSIMLEDKEITYSICKSLAGTIAPYGGYLYEPEAYQEWQLSIEGYTLNLALSPDHGEGNRGRLFTRVGDSFVTINFSRRWAENLNRDDMEKLAALFDYDTVFKSQPELIDPSLQWREKETAVPADGLFTVADYLQSPEYMAGSAFRSVSLQWREPEADYEGYEFHYGYYCGPIPTGVEIMDNELTGIEEQYGLEMPSEAKAVWNGKWVDPIGIDSLLIYSHSTDNPFKQNAASQEDCWKLLGVDNFFLRDNMKIMSAIAWDNGVWHCWADGEISLVLTYLPKGSFCPILTARPEAGSLQWAYESSAGEQISIGKGLAVYETETAYLIIEGLEGAIIDEASYTSVIQERCDAIDFTKFR